MSKKILLVDDEEDIRAVVRLTIESQFSFSCEEAEGGYDAYAAIKANPEDYALIVCDYSMPNGTGGELFEKLRADSIKIPFILCSAYSAGDLPEFANVEQSDVWSGPMFTAIRKPMVFDPLCKIMEEAPSGEVRQEEFSYFGVPMSVLLRIKTMPCDVQLRLSDDKYVRVFKQGDSFTSVEYAKYRAKGVDRLFLEQDAVEGILKDFENKLSAILDSDADSEDSIDVSKSTSELVYNIINVFGWKPELENVVTKNVNVAIKSLSKVPGLNDYLKRIDLEEDNFFAAHAHIVGLIAMGIAAELDVNQKTAAEKLMTSALMHDICIPDAYVGKIEKLNRHLLDGAPFDGSFDEVEEYKQHPLRAAELVANFENISNDIQQIVAAHHERPDGTGFPNQLPNSKISLLTAVFCVAEDLGDYIGHEPTEAKVNELISLREDVYGAGNYRKAFDALKRSLGHQA